MAGTTLTLLRVRRIAENVFLAQETIKNKAIEEC
jgi:hypothetical protein